MLTIDAFKPEGQVDHFVAANLRAQTGRSRNSVGVQRYLCLCRQASSCLILPDRHSRLQQINLILRGLVVRAISAEEIQCQSSTHRVTRHSADRI